MVASWLASGHQASRAGGHGHGQGQRKRSPASIYYEAKESYGIERQRRSASASLGDKFDGEQQPQLCGEGQMAAGTVVHVFDASSLIPVSKVYVVSGFL